MGKKEKNKSYYNNIEIKTAWNISFKYADILLKQVEKKKYNFNMIKKQYISELKSNSLDINKKKIYINIWDTVENTIHNKNTDDVIFQSMKDIYITSVKKID